jgi:hypothetical protein
VCWFWHIRIAGVTHLAACAGECALYDMTVLLLLLLLLLLFAAGA